MQNYHKSILFSMRKIILSATDVKMNISSIQVILYYFLWIGCYDFIIHKSNTLSRGVLNRTGSWPIQKWYSETFHLLILHVIFWIFYSLNDSTPKYRSFMYLFVPLISDLSSVAQLTQIFNSKYLVWEQFIYWFVISYKSL